MADMTQEQLAEYWNRRRIVEGYGRGDHRVSASQMLGFSKRYSADDYRQGTKHGRLISAYKIRPM